MLLKLHQNLIFQFFQSLFEFFCPNLHLEVGRFKGVISNGAMGR